jgi:undecaprenyl diphosphate synthase
MTSIPHIPQHVAIIMDGNGRWARQHGLSRLEGHRAGTENIRRVIETFVHHQVKYLTLYAFSTENWNRPRLEVRGLFHLLGQVIDRESRALHKKGVRIHLLGKLDGISTRLQRRILRALELTKDNATMVLSIALNYGGRAEILDAVRRIMSQDIPPESIDENLFDSYLYTAGLPDPDLIIRTAGELRLSNFLLWQAAYSEYYSTPTLWPDFDDQEIEKALLAYSQRQRRFGGLESQAKGPHS